MISKNSNGYKVKQDAKRKYRQYKRNHRNYKLILGVILFFIIVAISVSVYLGNQIQTQEQIIEYEGGELLIEKMTEISSEEIMLETPTVEVVDETAEKIESYMQSMNLEAKVGQLFLTTPEELTGIGIAVKAGETTKQKLRTYAVGGLIFTKQNFESLDQIQLMLNSLKVYTKIPLFLAIDEAGAQRVTNTNTSLISAGFNLESIDEILYCLDTQEDSSTLVTEALKVGIVEDIDAIQQFQDGYEILVIKENFIQNYELMLEAVRDETISEEKLDIVVRNIITYKVENGI